MLNNSPYIRAAMAQAVLKLMPPLLRETLYSEPKFIKEYGFKTSAVVVLGDFGLSIQSIELFDSIRAFFAGVGEVEVKDVKGRGWSLRNEPDKEGQPILVLSSGEQRLVISSFAVLSQDAFIRIRSLNKVAYDMNLPISEQDKWRKILTARALEDDEVDQFFREIRDTPIYLEQTIHSNILEGQSSASSLVPNSRRYFDSLIGPYDGSESIRAFAAGASRKFFQLLSEWRPYEGFLFSLLLSSHAVLTAEICVDHLDRDNLIRAYDFLEKHGDPLSRLGAFEIGLRILPQRPEVEPYLKLLIYRIRDDDVECNASEFNLFSALFVLVDGELSRTRLMAGEPPFYRRLASLAQAALIHRQLVKCGIDYDNFADWALSNRVEHYYMQSYADMRLEPRWNPNFAAAPQIKADFFGRLRIAGSRFEKNIVSGDLHDLILGDSPQSLPTLSELLRPFYPGPLEGAEDSSNPLPDVLARAIEEQLNTDELGPSSFVALVNSALVFKITSGHAELAAKALRLANYRLANVEDKSQLLIILNGLATVAAVSRNAALTAELRILVRRYRRDTQFGFSIEEAMMLCLLASAALEGLMEWREFSGEWLTELAFDEMDGDDGKVLSSYLSKLLHSVPELWFSCARADAALKAFCYR